MPDDTYTPFTREVVRIISAIPRGRVMTYGAIAAAAGSPRGARQVVRVLHSLSRPLGLPWHRVVAAGGRIALGELGGAEVQRGLLEREGVEFGLNGNVDIERFGIVRVRRRSARR